MNGLTLRISSDKKVKPLKRDIKKEDIHSLLTEYKSQDLTLLENLLDSKSVEQQVQSLKQLFDIVYTESLGHDTNIFLIDIFSYIFLNLKQKSPLLQCFLKFMSSAPLHLVDVIQNFLTSHLHKKLNETYACFEKISNVTFIVSICLENCNLARLSFLSCINVITKFIETSLKTCYSELKKEEAPIKKLSIINGIHGCVQTGINISQKYPSNVQTNLSQMTVTLLCEPDLPLDTRAASGILAAHILTKNNSEDWIETYKDILDANNDLGLLCFCSGLLNVLTPDDLLKVINFNENNKPTLHIIHDTILMIEDRNASESGIVLSATRCIVLVSRCYVKLPQLLKPEILKSFLIHIWGHSEHYMDAVRHLAISALSNLASIGKSHPELGIFEAILEGMSTMPVERRSKHAAIMELVSHVPVEEIINQSAGLVKALFATALANPSSNYALNSLESLIRQDLIERSDEENWFDFWIKPLLSSKLSAPLEHLLTAIIKTHPPILEYITSLGLNNSQENIEVILTCLKIGRKFNLLSGKDDTTKWKGLVDIGVLELCTYHFEDEVRLSCLSLLVENSKSTEEFTVVELNLLASFFNYNSSPQDPAVRQKILAYTKKMLTRFKDSHAAITRKKVKNLRRELINENENLDQHLEKYENFLTGLKKSCLESLFPGSSPSRRSFALGILAILNQSNIISNYDVESAKILLSCLLDSYEDNKVIARDLLSNYPLNILNLQTKENVDNYIKQTLLLSSSIRPPDSISAGYYMSLLALLPIVNFDEQIPYNSYYTCLTATLTALLEELKVAKESLLQAASSGPLYGHLFVIRHLLQMLDLTEIGKHAQWCSLIKEIIVTAFSCNDVVACIVYNSSPEGHIPMDFSYTESKREGDPQVTSQMVLLCSWRTVKEVSLLLGELSERASIKENESDDGLLTEDQILSIGEHLTGLLSETKHRGAFEQAYIGFSKLAGRLWKCSSGKLHELPKKWLDETLDCILANEKLSATRRSAGIPFIIQGLICSELESGSCKSLHKAMSTLLKISKEGSSEGKIHALNILRALYRGSSLGEAVGSYVAEGIAVAINGFNSSTWGEKNAATLLLSALMSRVFGVPRGKTEFLSWRNRMTGRLFFQRYPILYAELLSHLEASSCDHMYPALYPVLLLLGRLYPSSLEGTDSNLQLMRYVPYIMRCAQSSIMKTRALAATAISSLITSASYDSQINELMKNISETSHENHLHGYLLMVLKLILHSSTLEDLNHEKMKLNVNEWVKDLINILKPSKHSFIVKDTCIQVIIHFVVNYYSVITSEVINQSKSVLRDILFANESFKHYGYEVTLVHSTILLCVLNFKTEDIDELHDTTVRLLQANEYDVVGVTLDFLEFISQPHNRMFYPDIQDCMKLDLNSSNSKQKFQVVFRESKVIADILANKVLSECHQEDLVKLLKCFQYFPLAFKKMSEKLDVKTFFYSISHNSHRSVSSSAVNCIHSFLDIEDNISSLNENDIKLISNLVECHSDPESDYLCRLAAAQLLSNHFYNLIKNSSTESKLNFWVATVRLLLDENNEIRNLICCGTVGNVLPAKGLEMLIQKFVDTAEASEAIVGLLHWAIGEPMFEEEIEEGAVFDKGNVNSNYEDLILNRLVCKHFKKLVENGVLNIGNITIDQTLFDWLSKKTNFYGHSVFELISNYKVSADSCSDLNSLLPYRPSENQKLLEKYKLHNILEALKTEKLNY